ncbi:MAG: hypothetical protein GVY13_00595 [Alphaproteobacteria bacterium]|jgi:hypothetical protein|nr:hypothetical protein [Alphaproteobacteria bacterium]
MRPDDSEIRIYAMGLLESYGPHSLHYADDMVRAYLANGDFGGVAIWRQVLHQLQEWNGAHARG